MPSALGKIIGLLKGSWTTTDKFRIRAIIKYRPEGCSTQILLVLKSMTKIITCGALFRYDRPLQ